MFNLIKQVFIVLLIFSESLTIKRLSLNDEPGMVRPNLIDVNPVELKYYPCMISLHNCTGICYVLISKNMCSKRNKRHKFNLIWWKTKMKLEIWKNIFHVIVNASWIAQNVKLS